MRIDVKDSTAGVPILKVRKFLRANNECTPIKIAEVLHLPLRKAKAASAALREGWLSRTPNAQQSCLLAHDPAGCPPDERNGGAPTA
jgi:hypothetical protein